ncbi:MAG TPA: glycosyltransferase family 87 protein [Gemmata sp.]|nr:glycosyltransferase family 87 protein [Gemmata sp.]
MSAPTQEAILRPSVWNWGWRFHGLPVAQRIAVIAWVVVVAGIFGRVALSPRLPPSVIPVYRAAAERWMAGEDLYSSQHLWHVYRYPPCFAPSFVPFTYFPPRLGELLWRSLTIAVMLSGLWLWAKHALQLNPGQRGALFVLALPLCLTSLNNGQANILLAGLLLHGATAAIRCRGMLAGICVAVATAIKVYPIAVGMLLACANPKRIIPWLVVSIAGLAALPFLLAPVDYVAGEYLGFVKTVGSDTRHEIDHPEPPRDLFLVMRNYLVVPSEHTYGIIVLSVAAGMACTVAFASFRVRDPRISLVLAFDLGCVWMTVFGPATEPHTFALLAPTAAACLILSRTSTAQFAMTLCAYLLLITPVIRDFFPNGRVLHNLGIQPLGGLLLLGTFVMKWISDGIFCASKRGRDMIKVCEPSLANLSTTFRP